MQIQLSIFSWILEQEWDHFFLGFLVSPLGYRGMYLAMAGMTILFMIFFLLVSKNQEYKDIKVELE